MEVNYKGQKPLPGSDAISKSEGLDIFFSEYPIKIEKISIFIPNKESGGTAMASGAADVASKMTKPIIIILMIFAMPAALLLQKAIQSLEYLQYINIRYKPSNVIAIIIFASQGNLFGSMDIFGDFYKFDDGRGVQTTEELGGSGDSGQNRLLNAVPNQAWQVCQVHSIFMEEELDCHSWNNTAKFLFQLICIIIFGLFVKLIAKVMIRREEKSIKGQKLNQVSQSFEKINQINTEIKKKRGWFMKLIVYMDCFFSFQFYMGFCLGMELDMLIGAFVGLKYINMGAGTGMLNLIVSLVIIIFYAAVTVIISKKIWDFNKKSNDVVVETHKLSRQGKWNFLYTGVNRKISFAGYVVAMNAIKDFVISPILVFGIDDGIFQIVPILVVVFSIGVFVIFRMPFDKKIENYALFLNNISYTAVLIIFTMIHYSHKKDQKYRHEKLGTPCVIIICFIILLNICLAIYTIITMLYETYQKCKVKSKAKISAVSSAIKNKSLKSQLALDKRVAEKQIMEERKFYLEKVKDQSGVNMQKGRDQNESNVKLDNSLEEIDLRDLDLKIEEQDRKQRERIEDSHKRYGAKLQDLKDFGKKFDEQISESGPGLLVKNNRGVVVNALGNAPQVDGLKISILSKKFAAIQRRKKKKQINDDLV